MLPRPEVGPQDPASLYENELAMDVGGVCWGHNDETRAVIDHHFARDGGQFPAAAAAVLHLAPRIFARFGAFEDVWLVTHRDADFDGFSAMYLVRRILDGCVPHEGWQDYGLRQGNWLGGPEEIDWFRGPNQSVPPDRLWPLLLASYASLVDQGRPIRCGRHRTLHAVLYAALRRGRPYDTSDSGATEFFDEVVAQMVRRDDRGHLLVRNPAFDSVLEDSVLFRPELALLDRELEAYERDLSRAAKTVVFVQRTRQPFDTWFANVQGSPLLGRDFELNPGHLDLADTDHVPVDGVFIRDPDCILFKEWARLDTDNSPMGKGFLFTAVANSGRIPICSANSTEYFFSLDPERADQLHLYSCWARLQREHLRGLCASDHVEWERLLKEGHPRPGFEGRAGDLAGVFADPWFDGHNYRCTIVVTPNRGANIGPSGSRSDLTDDPVAMLVRRDLEFAPFWPTICICDFTTAHDGQSAPPADYPLLEAAASPPPAMRHGIRFGQIRLRDTIDLQRAGVADQIGRLLWRLLDTENLFQCPADFSASNLLAEEHYVAVWNRRGLAIAWHEQAKRLMEDTHSSLAAMASIAREFDALSVDVGPASDDSVLDARVQRAEKLLLNVIDLKKRMMLVEGRLGRRFSEANGLFDLFASAAQLSSAMWQRGQLAAAREYVRSLAETQKVAEVIEYFVLGVCAAEFWHALHPGTHAGVATSAEPVGHVTSASGWNWETLAAFAGVDGRRHQLAHLGPIADLGTHEVSRALRVALGDRRQGRRRLDRWQFGAAVSPERGEVVRRIPWPAAPIRTWCATCRNTKGDLYEYPI
ncbi:MAG: hypothetical protein NTY19_05285 [Planctomycetota bacterium]|nr:hypothetical protein [Planctomycetota bacterium]